MSISGEHVTWRQSEPLSAAGQDAGRPGGPCHWTPGTEEIVWSCAALMSPHAYVKPLKGSLYSQLCCRNCFKLNRKKLIQSSIKDTARDTKLFWRIMHDLRLKSKTNTPWLCWFRYKQKTLDIWGHQDGCDVIQRFLCHNISWHFDFWRLPEFLDHY